jgi:thiaminase
MNDIRQLTLQEHKNAENQPFVQTLMSGQIPPDLYATYLFITVLFNTRKICL